MRAKRVDLNQAEIIAALRAAGATVADTHTVGAGFPDLVVGIAGKTVLVEVKAEAGPLRLTEPERRFMCEWRGDPVRILRTMADVEELILWACG